MVNQKAEMLSSDATTGHATVKAGSIEATYFYDDQKMMSRVETKSPYKIRDLDLLQLIRRTNLDYVGVIRLINEIQLIDKISLVDRIALIDLISRIALVDRITLIDTITNIGVIGKIGSIPSFASTNNLVQNGSFLSGNLNGWIAQGAVYDGATLFFGYPTAKITGLGNFIAQYIGTYHGANTAFQFFANSALGNVNNLQVTMVYEDASSDTLTVTKANTGAGLVSFVPTQNKRISRFVIVNNNATDTIWVSIITGTVDYVDNSSVPNSCLEVIPKLKGKTAIVKSNYAINNSGTIYTVTAGTTFYLVGGMLNCKTNAVVDSDVFLECDTAGDGVFRVLLWITVSSSALIDRNNVTVPLALAVPMPFPAATVFRVRSSAGNLIGTACIQGWEE